MVMAWVDISVRVRVSKVIDRIMVRISSWLSLGL